MSDIAKDLPSGPSAIYMAARREWNERYGSYISRERWWRYTAIVSVVALAVSVACNAWQASQSRVAPYVVAVGTLGDAVAVHRLDIAPPVDTMRIKAQLARWVVDVRTVYTDVVAIKNNALEAYAWVERNSDANQQLDAWYRGNPPNNRMENETVGVVIESVSQIGKDTWQVDWSEERRPKDGTGPSVTYWRATMTVSVIPPKDDRTILANPSGIYLRWFNVTPRMR